MTLFAPAKSFSIGAEAPPAFSAAPHRIWSKHPGWRCQYCPPSQFVVALVYHAESLWRKSPKALCIFCFGTFRAATKFSLIFSLMASKFNHTVRQHLTARFLSKPLLPTLSGISQHDTKSPCDNSSPASRTKKYDHPLGGRIFLERRFCCAKSVACGRVIEREWGNPQRFPPHTPPSLRYARVRTTKPEGNHKAKETSVRMSLLFWRGGL